MKKSEMEKLRAEVNVKCKDCIEKCKQNALVTVCYCPHYKKVEENEK